MTASVLVIRSVLCLTYCLAWRPDEDHNASYKVLYTAGVAGVVQKDPDAHLVPGEHVDSDIVGAGRKISSSFAEKVSNEDDQKARGTNVEHKESLSAQTQHIASKVASTAVAKGTAALQTKARSVTQRGTQAFDEGESVVSDDGKRGKVLEFDEDSDKVKVALDSGAISWFSPSQLTKAMQATPETDGTGSHIQFQILERLLEPESGGVRRATDDMEDAIGKVEGAANTWAGQSHTALVEGIKTIDSASKVAEKALVNDHMAIDRTVRKHFYDSMEGFPYTVNS